MLMPLGLSQGKSQEAFKYLFIHSHVDASGAVSGKKSSNICLYTAMLMPLGLSQGESQEVLKYLFVHSHIMLMPLGLSQDR